MKDIQQSKICDTGISENIGHWCRSRYSPLDIANLRLPHLIHWDLVGVDQEAAQFLIPHLHRCRTVRCGACWKLDCTPENIQALSLRDLRLRWSDSMRCDILSSQTSILPA